MQLIDFVVGIIIIVGICGIVVIYVVVYLVVELNRYGMDVDVFVVDFELGGFVVCVVVGNLVV